MKTHDLLFELSHPVRYEILQLLSEKPLRLTKLGEKVDANNPEVSRHLDRLKNANLVKKNPDGSYYMTTFGEIMMPLLPTFSIIAAHPDYFLEHDLSLLPHSFIRRLGELGDCEISRGTPINLHRMEETAGTCTTRIYTMSNEFVSKVSENDPSISNPAVDSEFDFKWVLPESQLEDTNLMAMADQCGPSQDDHYRVVPRVPLFISILDNEVLISFLDEKGRTDFSLCFCSKHPDALKWGMDLFHQIWDSGQLLSGFR
jgi:predicted transcriptional regulator